MIGILVVEQEMQLHLLMQKALQPHGYHLITSASFREGLRLFEQHKDHIALVLLGGSILGGNAERILTAFQSLHPRLFILVMTGDISSHDPEILIALGVSAVLQKPFEVSELLQVLRDTLFEQSPDPRNEQI